MIELGSDKKSTSQHPIPISEVIGSGPIQIIENGKKRRIDNDKY